MCLDDCDYDESDMVLSVRLGHDQHSRYRRIAEIVEYKEDMK